MRAATATSVIVLLGTLLLITFRPQFSLAPDLHVRVDRGWSIRFAEISFFSDLTHGPTRGTTLEGVPFEVDSYFGLPWVFYYWHLKGFGSDLWAISFNLWLPIILSAVLPVIWLWRRMWKWQRR